MGTRAEHAAGRKRARSWQEETPGKEEAAGKGVRQPGTIYSRYKKNTKRGKAKLEH